MMLDARIQRAAEQLTDNESLTNNLDDAAAMQLLDWGLRISQKLVKKTSMIDDEYAEKILYQPLKLLRRVLRRINKLAGSPATYSPEEIEEALTNIFTPASEMGIVTVTQPENLNSTARMIRMLPPDSALDKILSYLTIEGEEINDEETEIE